MTRRSVTDEQFGQLQRRLAEVSRRIDEGAIPFKDTMDGLQKLIEGTSALPTEMTVGGRTYEILGFLEGKEENVVGHTMVERAVKMNANLGAYDGQHLLDHQDEIPAILQGKVYFVFTDWRHPDNSGRVYYVYWDENSQCWVRDFIWLGHGGWNSDDRVLRRK